MGSWYTDLIALMRLDVTRYYCREFRFSWQGIKSNAAFTSSPEMPKIAFFLYSMLSQQPFLMRKSDPGFASNLKPASLPNLFVWPCFSIWCICPNRLYLFCLYRLHASFLYFSVFCTWSFHHLVLLVWGLIFLIPHVSVALEKMIVLIWSHKSSRTMSYLTSWILVSSTSLYLLITSGSLNFSAAICSYVLKCFFCSLAILVSATT